MLSTIPFMGIPPTLSPVYPVDTKNKQKVFNEKYLPDVEHSVLDTATYLKKTPLQSKIMSKELGWIKLHRSSFNNNLYFQEPFTRWQAWCDLLLLANHTEGFFRVRGIKITVARGQVGHTSTKLAERWKWSRGKVVRFLDELEKDQQIVQQNSNVSSLISVVNYEKYQGDDTANGTAENYQKNGTTYGTANGTANNEKTVQQTVQQNSFATNSNTSVCENGFMIIGTANGTSKVTVNGHQTGQETDINKNDKNIKKEESNKINAEGFSPSTPPESIPGFNYLSDGRSYIEPTVFFYKEQFNGLPEENTSAIIDFFASTKKVQVTQDEIQSLWNVFKVQELTEQKPYRNKADVYRHFFNWSKKQSFSKAPKIKPDPKPKSAEKEKTTPNLQNLANRYD